MGNLFLARATYIIIFTDHFKLSYTMKQPSLSLLFSLLALLSAEARHILGGYMSYRYVGDSVQIKMVIYRDCLGGGAPFDNPASIAVYRDGALFQELGATLMDINNITPWPLPCDPVNFPNLCLEVGTYFFVLHLPQNDTTGVYDVVYQRCCRNNSNNNLIDPGGTGHTLTVSIIPDARRWKNSSPDFPAEAPKFLACLYQPITFNLSATDAEGDSLVYGLCNPLSGGGPVLTAPGVWACTGAVPTPPCAPPFDPVLFAAPTYSFDKPFAADSLTLNPFTGQLRFTPTMLGLFSYAVCVEEYRNGKLLSRVQHELFMVPLDGISPAAEPPSSGIGQLRLSPNPTSSMLDLNLHDFVGQHVEIRISDAVGRVVFFQKKQAEPSERFSVGELVAGVYTLQVRAEGRVAQGQFVRQ